MAARQLQTESERQHVEAGWVDRTTGEPVTGEEASPYAEPFHDLPRPWRESRIWVCDPQHDGVAKYPPGMLR